MRNELRKMGAVIMAAGKGTRMKSKNANKVTFLLADKPIIKHTVDLLEEMGFKEVVIVVGFAKKSVMEIVKNKFVVFAEQKKRLGTGHAVRHAIKKLSPEITDVLTLGGDDSAFYRKKIVSELRDIHFRTGAAFTFLTITVDNPFGLGRIVRDDKGEVTAVVEEKDATDEQRKITEVNPACYLFKVDFLKKYLPLIKKSPVSGEYYLTSLIDIAMKHKEKIATLQAGHMPWRGINTKEELKEAERIFMQLGERE